MASRYLYAWCWQSVGLLSIWSPILKKASCPAERPSYQFQVRIATAGGWQRLSQCSCQVEEPIDLISYIYKRFWVAKNESTQKALIGTNFTHRKEKRGSFQCLYCAPIALGQHVSPHSPCWAVDCTTAFFQYRQRSCSPPEVGVEGRYTGRAGQIPYCTHGIGGRPSLGHWLDNSEKGKGHAVAAAAALTWVSLPRWLHWKRARMEMQYKSIQNSYNIMAMAFCWPNPLLESMGRDVGSLFLSLFLESFYL